MQLYNLITAAPAPPESKISQTQDIQFIVVAEPEFNLWGQRLRAYGLLL